MKKKTTKVVEQRPEFTVVPLMTEEQERFVELIEKAGYKARVNNSVVAAVVNSASELSKAYDLVKDISDRIGYAGSFGVTTAK